MVKKPPRWSWVLDPVVLCMGRLKWMKSPQDQFNAPMSSESARHEKCRILLCSNHLRRVGRDSIDLGAARRKSLRTRRLSPDQNAGRFLSCKQNLDYFDFIVTPRQMERTSIRPGANTPKALLKRTARRFLLWPSPL